MKGRKFSSLEDKGHQGEENVVILKIAQPVRRSIRSIAVSAQYRDGNSLNITACFLAGSFDYCEASCFDEARGVKQLGDAMDEEMRSLLKKK